MQCPLFKNASDDWCLRERCRHYDIQTDKCTYETYVELKKRKTEKDKEAVNDGKIH